MAPYIGRPENFNFSRGTRAKMKPAMGYAPTPLLAILEEWDKRGKKPNNLVERARVFHRC